jgi:hypothetical protein
MLFMYRIEDSVEEFLFIPVRSVLQPVRDRAWGDCGKVRFFDFDSAEPCR